MKVISKNFGYIAVLLFVVSLVSATSCKKGATLGVVGFEDTVPPVLFDTFPIPTCDYFFYGKFNGHFRTWCNAERSLWDSATRVYDPFDLGQDSTKWNTWDAYDENIYYNFCEQEIGDFCPDSVTNVFTHTTRFIRPNNPEDRIELSFFKCVDVTTDMDTIPEFDPRHGEQVTKLFLEEVANPFSNSGYYRYGAQLKFTDSDRTEWTTKEGSGQLRDTYIRITDFYPRAFKTDTLDTFAMYIAEGEFAGRLYNGRKEMVVTEAKFRARVVPQVTFMP